MITLTLGHPERKRKRCFHRVMSGINKQGVVDLRFLTLTSAIDSPSDIGRSWTKMVRKLKRMNVVKSYIKVQEFTRSGLRHLHILFRGSFVDVVIISKMWQRIHKAEVVFVQKAYGSTKVAGYLAKYMAKGGERYSWDWGWVHLGFGKAWSWFKGALRYPMDIPYDQVLSAWRDHCVRIHELEEFWGVSPGRVHVACDEGSLHYYSGTVGMSGTLRELVGDFGA